MKQQKVLNPLPRKFIYFIGIIWLIVLLITALIEPDLPNWGYLIIAMPLILLFLFAGYAVSWTLFHTLIEWIAVTSDRAEIKIAIRNFIIGLIIILVAYKFLK